MKVALIVLLAVGGCGKKNALDENLRHALEELAKPKPNLGLVTADCAVLAGLDQAERTQRPARELVAICEKDLPLAEAKQLIETARELAGSRAPGGTSCNTADLLLSRLDSYRTVVTEVRAKWDEVCKPKAAVVAEKPAKKPTEAKPSADASIQDVTDLLPEIEKLIATDLAMADVRCTTITDDIDALLASADAKTKELGAKADRLCHYTVPLMTIDTVKDCTSQDAQNAFMNLGFHKNLADAKVAATIAAWDKRCPSNKLVVR
jgi:hypothetical protein